MASSTFDLDDFKDDMQLTLGEHTMLPCGGNWYVCAVIPCMWMEEHTDLVDAKLAHRKHVVDELVKLMASWT